MEQVLGSDDVASAPKGSEARRRGVAGIFYIYKIAGALAGKMASLDAVKAIALKVSSRVRTMRRRAFAMHNSRSSQANFRNRRRLHGDWHGNPWRGRCSQGAAPVRG